MKPIAATSVVLLLTSTLNAQTAPPALMIKEGDRSVPLGISKVDTQVRIFGYVAETTTTLTFSNPHDRVLEGDLYFPLPQGATISGYALDIEGKMIDGAVVEKHKGREVFEKIVRQGIDPGLVEWTKGNNFKTRVFPIPAKGSRTVRVSYVGELVGDRGQEAYHLPLRYQNKIAEFSLRVEVVKPSAVPKVVQGAPANFEFARWRDSYVAETELRDVAATEDLVVALPNVEKQNLLVEIADDGECYFAIHDFPEVPSTLPVVPPPRRVVVYWDASGSRGGRDHSRELGLLRSCIESWNVPGAPPTVDVELILIRNVQSKPRRFTLSRSNPAPLIAALEQVRYDGGTQMGALSPLPGAKKPDLYLLFSDGLSNFGRQEPKGLDAPVYVFSDDATANHSFLRYLAMTTGGQYFNLMRLRDADVVAAMRRSAYSFLAAEGEGTVAETIYPKLPQPIAGRFSVVGKLTADQGSVTLKYGMPGRTLNEKRFNVARADAVEGTLLKRLWAQTKLDDLVVFQEENEEEIVALGKQYGMVTPYTSLIVLDSLEQYVEHEIAPPESLPEMRAAYLRQVDTLEHQQRKQKADKLAAVLEMWQERVKWWNHEFKYPKDFKYKPPKGEKAAEGGDLEDAAPFGEASGEERMESAEPMDRTAAPARSATPAEPVPTEEPAAADPFGDGPARMEPNSPSAMPQGAANGQGFGGGAFGGMPDGGEDETRSTGRQPGIAIKPWDPKTPYLKQLKAANPAAAFDVYMNNRTEYGNSPAFFLDCADHFAQQNEAALSLQVLSNLAELELENPALLRVLAHRLAQTGRLDLAVLTFEEVLRLRPEEPQSYRDLALVLARRARQNDREAAAVRDDLGRAIELLAKVVMGHWDDRFIEIELIALEELNALVPRAKAAGIDEIPIDSKLIQLLDVDVRIVMTWDADNTDIDLWVIEPSGEKAFYSHNRTTIGGLVSNDFTDGYGPEEYMVRKAMPGVYDVKANYYGSRAARLLGAVTVQVDVFTNFGRENQAHKAITVRLKEAEETVTIGQVEF